MAFPQDRRRDLKNSLVHALRYSSQFKFPLTQSELWLWQPGTTFARKEFTFWPHQSDGYYFLPGRKADIITRQSRVLPSRRKLNRARKISDLLCRIPTVQAIYLTGSAAASNSSDKDDIDVMIITSANCVWITRLVVVSILTFLSLRRPPGLPDHSSRQVADKICDNLYLDENFLTQAHNPANYPRSLYLAHEILQAVPIWSRNNIPARFLLANSWTRKYLPVIYAQSLPKSQNRVYPSARAFPGTFILNLCLFFPQYIYMRSRFTNERISLHSAFFHPNQYAA